MAGAMDAWVELPRARFARDAYDGSPPYVVRLSYRPRASTPPAEDAGENVRLATAKAAVLSPTGRPHRSFGKAGLPQPTLPDAAQSTSQPFPRGRTMWPADVGAAAERGCGAGVRRPDSPSASVPCTGVGATSTSSPSPTTWDWPSPDRRRLARTLRSGRLLTPRYDGYDGCAGCAGS